MAVQIRLRGWVTSVHASFASAFCKNLHGAPLNNIAPQVIEVSYFWDQFCMYECIVYHDMMGIIWWKLWLSAHESSRTLWQRRLLTLTFFLLPPSFVAHKYGDSANARRDRERERVMVRLRLNILHAKYDHRERREKEERAATLHSTLAKWHRFPRQ